MVNHGYAPVVPSVRVPGKSPEPYLSWADPVRGGPIVARMDTKNFWFIRREDLPRLASSGGTVTEDDRRHNVHFAIGVHSVGKIVQAAERIKR